MSPSEVSNDRSASGAQQVGQQIHLECQILSRDVVPNVGDRRSQQLFEVIQRLEDLPGRRIADRFDELLNPLPRNGNTSANVLPPENGNFV